MNDLMEKLQSVLSDKESMQQLQELAAMLTGGQEGEAAAPSPVGADTADRDGGAAAMPDLTKLMALSGAVSQAGKGDKNIALLLALRPLLKEENQAKLDRVVKLLRLMALWPMLRESGLLGGDLFGGL